MTARVLVPSMDASLAMKLLPAVLGITAGNVDVISFLGLGACLPPTSPVAPMLSVPVFMAVLGLTRLLVGGSESIGLASLRPLLLLQLLLLAAFS